MTQTTNARLLRRIRFWLAAFMAGLVLSGLTAFPLERELNLLAQLLGAAAHSSPREYSGLLMWVVKVRNALRQTNAQFPFLAYGTDWLAFAHLVISVAFIGPWRDPVRNKWVIDWGLICCAAIWPLALVCGSLRGIPFYWRLIDCSFGVVGAIPLWWCRKWIVALEREEQKSTP